MQEKGRGRTGLDFIKSDGCMRECVKTQNSEKPPLPIDGSDPLRHQTRGCVKIDTSSFLFFLYLVYHIIHYLLQLCC